MQRFFDKLIGYVRAIEVAGVDVGDTEANNLAQDRECTVVVCRRPEYMRTSQLHGTVPRAGKDQIIGELECASWQCCRRRTLSFGFYVRLCHRKPRGWRCNATFIRNASPTRLFQSVTVTRKKVAGMDVVSLFGLLFWLANNSSSSLCRAAARPFFSAASNAFMVGP